MDNNYATAFLKQIYVRWIFHDFLDLSRSVEKHCVDQNWNIAFIPQMPLTSNPLWPVNCPFKIYDHCNWSYACDFQQLPQGCIAFMQCQVLNCQRILGAKEQDLQENDRSQVFGVLLPVACRMICCLPRCSLD